MPATAGVGAKYRRGSLGLGRARNEAGQTGIEPMRPLSGLGRWPAGAGGGWNRHQSCDRAWASWIANARRQRSSTRPPGQQMSGNNWRVCAVSVTRGGEKSSRPPGSGPHPSQPIPNSDAAGGSGADSRPEPRKPSDKRQPDPRAFRRSPHSGTSAPARSFRTPGVGRDRSAAHGAAGSCAARARPRSA